MFGDDDDWSEFAVDGGDQAESQRRVGLENEYGGYSLRGLPRRPLTVEGAHQDAEIEPGDVDQLALVEVRPSAQPCSTHAAAIEDMGEGPLDHFSPSAHGLAPDIRSQPHAIGVDRFARRLVAMPTQVALGRLGFGDARLPHAILERLQLFARVIPLVGDHDAGRILARRQSDRVEVARGGVQRRRKRRRIAFVGRMDRRGHDDAGVEVDRVLRLAGQMRRFVLHLGDPGVRVGRALPVGVRQHLAVAARAACPPAARPFAVFITEAAQRFSIPESWIRAVMRVESCGDPPAISQKGAIGLMQVMPKTYAELRIRHRRGGDLCDPHDNILAGAAYLRVMLDRYGAPGVLAAYNAGPARYDEHLMKGRPLPGEIQDYVAKLAPMIGVQQGDERTAHSFDLIAWLHAALFPPHADPSPGAVLLAVRAQPDRSPAVRRNVDL